MSEGYWATMTGRRLSRRRALATSGAMASAAAILAACGGGENYNWWIDESQAPLKRS